MDPKQLLKTSKVYSKSKKCETEQTLGVGTTPLVARRLTIQWRPLTSPFSFIKARRVTLMVVTVSA